MALLVFGTVCEMRTWTAYGHVWKRALLWRAARIEGPKLRERWGGGWPQHVIGHGSGRDS